jgi:DNA end-binding protein Ku
MSKRERVIALEPFGKGLLGTTLHYDYEVRKADDYFDEIPDVKIAPDMLKLAQHIVDSKEGEFQPDLFVDHYEEAVIEIIKKKQAHEPLRKSAERPSAPKNVVNLMDALRKSVATEAAKPAKAKGKKRVAGQGEMLLPIAGKKGKEATRMVTKPAARQKAS